MNTMQGSWRALPVGDTDPKTLKIRIKVLGMMEGIPEDALPWAEFLLPVGTGYTPAAKGEMVWVDFPYNGDTRRPRILGAAMDWEKGSTNTAAQTGGKGTQYTPPKVQGQPTLPTLTPPNDQVVNRNGILEVRAFNGDPKNPKSGYMIVNMANHSTIAMNQDGDIIISTTGNVFVHAGKNMTLDSGADLTIKAKGKILVEAGGDFTQKGATLNVESSGAYSFKASTATFKAGHFGFTK